MDVTKTIDQLAQGYEIAREVLSFRSNDGLSIADYNAILLLPNASRLFPSCVADGDLDYEMSDLVGFTKVGSHFILTFRDLWDMFLRARGELFRLFSNKQPNLQLEDIILIQRMFQKDTIERNLGVVKVLDEQTAAYMFSRRSPSTLLRELLTVSYTPSREEFCEFFVNQINHEFTQGLSVSLSDMVDFALTQPPLSSELYEHLSGRFLANYIPEIDVRHWEGLVQEEFLLRVQEQRNPAAACYTAMREAGIPDEISNWRDPEMTCRELIDIVKNGCFSGKSLLNNLARRLKQS